MISGASACPIAASAYEPRPRCTPGSGGACAARSGWRALGWLPDEDGATALSAARRPRRRPRRGRRSLSYAGLAPVTRQSGSSLRRRGPQPPRQPPAQERDVPCRLRLAARPSLEGLLRPQARRGEKTQRRSHLPRAPALRRHPGHAPLEHAVSGVRSRTTSLSPRDGVNSAGFRNPRALTKKMRDTPQVSPHTHYRMC